MNSPFGHYLRGTTAYEDFLRSTMSHDASHGHDHVHEPDHAEDTVATRLMGIAIGILTIFVCISIQRAMGWHEVVGGILTGTFGMIFGALGTSIRRPSGAAILGWAGGIAFFTSILMFFGLRIF